MRDQHVSIGSTAGFKLPRACIVTVVPAGHRTTLEAGQRVTLMQALGGTATVTTAALHDNGTTSLDMAHHQRLQLRHPALVDGGERFVE